MKLVVLSNVKVSAIIVSALTLRTILAVAGGFYIADLWNGAAALLMFVAYLGLEAFLYYFGETDVVYLRPIEDEDENSEDR